MQIHDPRSLRTFARRFCGRSHLLDGCVIHVVDSGSAAAGIQFVISNGLDPVIAIRWIDDGLDTVAHVLPGSVRLRAADVEARQDLAIFIDRFLRRHGFIDARGRSTRKGVA